MKTAIVIGIAMSVLGALTMAPGPAPWPSSVSAKTAASPKSAETPFACNRLAIKPEQRQRKDQLDKLLRTSVRATKELADGFEFAFDPAMLQAIAEWVAMERACCPFFDFTLRLDREGGPLRLRLTGREGVKQFIKADFGDTWLKH